MKKFLLFAFLVFLVAGCAEDTTTDNGTTSGGQTSPEQLAKVDEAFATEYKKYVKQDDLSTTYVGEFSAQSETNIKSLLQNITGRGKMPANVGIGEINETVVASSLAKSMAESLIGATEAEAQALVKYTTLDTDANTFISSVTAGLMRGTTGSEILDTGKSYRANQKAIAMLVASHTALFQAANETVTEEGTANLAYLYSSLTGYFGMLQITALPTDEATVNKIARAVYDHCKTSASTNADTYNTINTYNANTTTFKVMPILTCGTRNPMGDDMKAFMNGVGQAINPDYQFTMPSIRP